MTSEKNSCFILLAYIITTHWYTYTRKHIYISRTKWITSFLLLFIFLSRKKSLDNAHIKLDFHHQNFSSFQYIFYWHTLNEWMNQGKSRLITSKRERKKFFSFNCSTYVTHLIDNLFSCTGFVGLDSLSLIWMSFKCDTETLEEYRKKRTFTKCYTTPEAKRDTQWMTKA